MSLLDSLLCRVKVGHIYKGHYNARLYTTFKTHERAFLNAISYFLLRDCFVTIALKTDD